MSVGSALGASTNCSLLSSDSAGVTAAPGAAGTGIGAALSRDGIWMAMSLASGFGSESSTIGKPTATASASATAPTRRRRARFFSGSTGSSAAALASLPRRGAASLALEARLERARVATASSSRE